jgi:secreted trypsin-like serine protease
MLFLDGKPKVSYVKLVYKNKVNILMGAMMTVKNVKGYRNLIESNLRQSKKNISWISFVLIIAIALILPLTPEVSFSKVIKSESPALLSEEQYDIVSPRIVGGSEVSISTAPWQVALIDVQYSNNFFGQFCGGSLISATWIVTAAHCVVRGSRTLLPSALKIQTGDSTLSMSSLSGFSVSEIVVHPQYRSTSKNHDIALLRLSTPVTLGETTQAISIYRGEISEDTVGYVTGWGETTTTSPRGDYFFPTGGGYYRPGTSNFPTKLHGTYVWVSDKNCWGAKPKSFRSDLMVCAGTRDWLNDTCQGDSGGPLAIEFSGRNYLAGVTSFGAGCAWLSPGIYTKVSRYASWIFDRAGLDLSATPSPSISGYPVVGQTLTAETGMWNPTPSFSYQWLSNNSPISGATNPTYLVSNRDLRRVISVRVTGTEPGYRLAFTSSQTSAISATMPFSQSPTPTITGTPIEGHTLTAQTGAWDPQPTFTYQWLSNNKPIKSAKASTYELKRTDFGNRISVRIEAKLSGYTTRTITSSQTDAISPGVPFDSTSTPTISGAAVVGRTLTASAGVWDPEPNFSYQWLSSNKVIRGATGSTYVVRSADLNKPIRVRVTATRAGYAATSLVSAVTSRVARTMPFSQSPTPTISGITILGETLTASVTGWAPLPTSFTYQWLRNGSDISRATGPTYVLTSADLGRRISVRVVATLSGYTTTTVTSNRTAAISP